MTQEHLNNIIKLAMMAHTRKLICDTLKKAPYFSPGIYDDAISELEGAELALVAAIDEARE